MAGESWFVVSLVGMFLAPPISASFEVELPVGICIGVNAALISIVTEWLSDLKMGYCYDGWWLNQQFCCWEIDSEGDACDSWHEWSNFTPVRWVVYVIFAVRSAPVQKETDPVCLMAFFLVLGVVLVYRRPSRSVLGKIRCRVWDIRDKVHLGWIRNERISRILDIRDKKPDVGGLIS